jgi:hypothetical protein
MSRVISVPFGKYPRAILLVFSLVPRSHRECACAKYTGISVARVRAVCPLPAVPGDLPRHHRRVPADRGGYALWLHMRNEATGDFLPVGQCKHFPARFPRFIRAFARASHSREILHTEIPYAALEELADQAGISLTTVARLERRPNAPCRGRTLGRLARALGEHPAATMLRLSGGSGLSSSTSLLAGRAHDRCCSSFRR